MADALIGHTGFVGGNLCAQRSFDELFNSRNIDSIAGRTFDTIVCAGAPAEKWRANRDPEADRTALRRLLDPLGRVVARRFILISTVDVYPRLHAVDETTDIDPEQGQPYGRHRYELEREIGARFQTTVVRLPGLYGPGLKKNAIFDLLHGNRLDQIPSDGIFQFYGLARLWNDVESTLRDGIRLVNLATEPVSIREVAAECFGIPFDNRTSGSPPHYDVRTRYASTFGGRGAYLESRVESLTAIRRFVEGTGLRSRTEISPIT